MNKYHSKKITRNGITYDSVKEYRRHCDLLFLQKIGEIKDLQRQVKFVLIPAQYETVERYSEKTGKRLKDKRVLLEQECSYIADFVYEDKNGRVIVEDVKVPITRTKDYRIKKKMMLYFHGIRIKEV